MFVRNNEIGLFLDTRDFKTLELENGTHNGQPVYRVAFKFLYMQGVAVFTVAIFSKKEDAQKCYDDLMEMLIKEENDFLSDKALIVDVENNVEDSKIIMPDKADISNVALQK